VHVLDIADGVQALPLQIGWPRNTRAWVASNA
jgi:hypothetical protein